MRAWDRVEGVSRRGGGNGAAIGGLVEVMYRVGTRNVNVVVGVDISVVETGARIKRGGDRRGIAQSLGSGEWSYAGGRSGKEQL